VDLVLTIIPDDLARCAKDMPARASPADRQALTMTRFGLCCIFRDQPIKFSTTTATAMARLPRAEALARLSRICLANADALRAALEFCACNEIGCFRIQSQVLPLKTHPQQGYTMDELPAAEEIARRFRACGAFARAANLRTCFHPDQFVVLNSPRPEVVEASIRELEYQAEVAGWVGADVLNVHAGGSYGDKPKALAEFARSLSRLSPAARGRLTVENDDKTYTVADLLPLCRAEGLPLVYDVHHHRCHPDGLAVGEATELALATWDREPLFHLSSPLGGWSGPRPERHHDFIDPADFPRCWLDHDLTVEVEAKAKEVAVLRLMGELCSPR
jgi:UV DNA damage endonuclease